MNKGVIMFFAMGFEVAGNYLPSLWGQDIFSVWSILAGMVLGLFGIWVGVVISKRFF